MSHLLKLLSGTLAGVEYRLSVGDTIFHVGPRSALEDGTVGQLLGASENAFYVPDEINTGAFRIHLERGGTDVPERLLRLEVRETDDIHWKEQPLAMQQAVTVVGITIAVRDEEHPWADDLRAFNPQVAGLPASADHASGSASQGPNPRTRQSLVLCVLALLGVAGAGIWHYWSYQPEAQLRELGEVLHGAPSHYQSLAGNDGRLHVFANDAAARTWAERASRRLARSRDVHRVTRVEARRLEEHLVSAGMEVVVVRLDDARQPEVVLNGTVDAARRQQVQKVLAEQAPYARSFAVSGITDQQLLQMARAELATLGISVQTVPDGSRVSVLNRTTLDDVGLQAMTHAAKAFHRRWGERRLTIQPQLWDDLLQGRSYRYSPGQLVSIGEGRWRYAGAVGTRGHASP